MLEAKGLTKRFGSTAAVDGIDLEIPAGQMVGIIGKSGAGKSTLLRMTNRLIEPTEGSLRFEGTDITALRGKALLDWRARCAMIFQQFNLVPRLNVVTNVLTGRLRRSPLWRNLIRNFRDEDVALAIAALEKLGMSDFALKRADQLSGGQQQRVAIARAMVQQPDIILADEPIASLDPLNAQLVMDALQQINRDEGLTVVCNLHTLDTARAYCARVIGMAEGKIVFDGHPGKLDGDTVRRIYGVDAEDGGFDEGITSTAIKDDRKLALVASQ